MFLGESPIGAMSISFGYCLFNVRAEVLELFVETRKCFFLW
jgi:hypothetical protein